MRCLLRLSAAVFVAFAMLQAHAQHVILSGLRSVNGMGTFHGLRQDAAGNLYTLLEAHDGVRLLKFNSAGTQFVGQVQIGQPGDSGIALDVDSAGNVYVAGTSDSRGSLTGTSGTAFPSKSGTRTNSFIAKFSPTLTVQWLTFCGAEPMSATGVTVTGSSVIVTGSVYSVGDPNNTLPVTPNGIQQSPAPNSTGNGFIESFSTSSGTLQYATYLTGANGDTTPAAIVADNNGNAYIAGTTTASGFPTTSALVSVFRSVSGGSTSGFVTKLTPAGDGFLFSTFIPGNGLTSIALDTNGLGALLLSGDVSTGLFPVTEVQSPIAPLLAYQTAIRLALDGSSVLSSTLVAAATESVIAPGSNGISWVFSSNQSSPIVPLLPVVPLETLGNAFALRVAANGRVDRAARFGGLPTANSGYASLPAAEGGVLVEVDGTAAMSGGISPTLSSSLLATETYDLPLASAPNAALPNTVRDALPPASCSGSVCSGGAGLLARLDPNGTAPTLALSIDNLPNLTLRNLGTSTANNVQVAVSGYSMTSSCPGSLAAGEECSLALSGSGPGSISVQADNTASFNANLSATTRMPNAIAVLPHELDFGIVTSGSAIATRVLTVVNLSSATQTFASKNTATISTTRPITTPYAIAQTATTCTPATDGVSLVLGPGGTCTITLGLSASNSSSNDGGINAHWQVGASDILLTGYDQAAAESISASTVDFGRQFVGGLRAPRYLYLSNSSDTAQAHATVVSSTAAFTVTDECPSTLEARSVCRIALGYQAASAPSSDAMSLAVDGLVANVLGETLPQPSITAASTNPNLSVSPASVVFATPVAATSASSESHGVTVSNTGVAPFALNLSIAGDFTYQTGCPATLNGGASCTVVLTFTPTNSGSRQGLLSVGAGSSGPVYVELSGTGTAILPVTNGGLAFGDVPLNTPAVQWLKISQSFATLQVASSDPNFRVVLVEDRGYGHGDPTASAYTAAASGSCLNCWLGIQFLTTSTGAHYGALSLASPGGGKPESLIVTGNGIALTGLVLTPVTQDFGPVPVHSTSASIIFQLTNGTSSAITATGATVSGDFTLTAETTGGQACTTGQIAPGASCFVPVRFVPTASGTRTGTLTTATSAGQVTANLTGTGSDDPGVSFTPGELIFDNVPGTAAQQQSITITNTGSTSATVGTPASSDTHFAASSTCGTLAPGATCTISVSYAATNALASGTLTVPVTSAPAGAPSIVQYAVAVTGLYTTESAGLQIIPGEHTAVNFGASPTSSPALNRILHVNNLTSKSLVLTVDAPRQFVVTASTCAALAPNGSCDLTVQYTPQTGGDATGTIFVLGTPTDGTAVQSGLAYMEGYGSGDSGGTASLAITGNISPGGVVSFGQVSSGGNSSQTLTLTNPVASAAGTNITVRRVSTDFPYAATTNCGAPLAPGQSCTVTVTYTPLYQAQTGSGQTSAQTNDATLTIGSDGYNAPQFIDLNGTATPVFVASPNNSAPVAAFTTSAGSLDFTSIAVGTASAAQSAILTNTGTATVHIGSLIASSGFTASAGTCATLVTGATCTLSVTFVPQTTGTTLGSLEVQTDATQALEFLTLLGTVVAPTSPVPVASASLAPQSLDFGRVLVGRISSQVVTFTNTGQLPVTLGTYVVSGDSSFTLATSTTATNPCPAPGTVIAPGAICTVTILFTPATTGTLRGTLSVASSATTLPLIVALSGVGTQPQLSVSPAALNFGTVAVGSTSTLSLTLVNSSGSPVDGLAFLTTSGYSVSSTCGITTLNANSSCAVSITFAPTASGVLTGALTINSTDPAAPLTIPLSGAGVVAGAASQTQLSATPGALAFGNIAVGSSGTLALTLSNPTSVPANGLLFTVTAGYAVSNGCAGALNAYSTCPVVVSFAPTTTGVDAGTLTIRNSASTTPLTVALTGTGTTVQPQLTLTPASLNLGTVAVGGSGTGSLTLTNSTSTPVNNIVIVASTGFSYAGGCPATLNANSSCSILVTFTPTSTGTATGTLVVTSSDPASPLTAALSGNSIQSGSFTLTVNGSSTASVTVQSGLPASYSLLVTPNGSYTGVVDLTCAADTPVQYAACSLVPPSVTLSSSSPQSSTATISTVSASDTNPSASLGLQNKPLLCLSPALLVLLLRRKRPATLLLLLCAFTLTGCGGGGDSRIRYVNPGTYTFHVTATSTNSTPVSQTVTLTLVVTPRP